MVFGNDVIIFSDKYCVFPNSGDLALDWDRWFRRAVASSAHQAWGAERWLRTYPERIFLDRQCTQPFPLDVPSTSEVRFHLVVVAHDVSRRCAQEFGGSGSMMIQNNLKGLSAHRVPFSVGDLDAGKSFVHVLDDATLDIIMRTLDTISDFTAYLRKKELLVRSARRIFAAGDEELLAAYLTEVNSND